VFRTRHSDHRNALGHYYAINLLYPLLRKTSKLPDTPKSSVRIVFESSEMHRAAPGSEDSKERARGCHFGSEEEITEGGKQMGPIELYGRTKLAMILYGKALRDKVIQKNGDDVYVCEVHPPIIAASAHAAVSVHPGAVNTEMQAQWKDAYPGIVGKVLMNGMLAFGRDPEQGAYSALYAALSPEVVEKGWNGVYLSDPVSLR
jgi:NAD(P)-dependent dehydrogenase (short-subunit alcohol dehydrogenase family)